MELLLPLSALLFSGGTRRPVRASPPRAGPGRDSKAKGDQTVLAVFLVLALTVVATERKGAPILPAQWLIVLEPSLPGKSSAKTAMTRPRIVQFPFERWLLPGIGE